MRQQSTPAERLRWNALAVEHAHAVSDGRADELFASLYLNLADSHLALGDHADALAVSELAAANLGRLAPGAYRDFVARGIERLQARLVEEQHPHEAGR